LSGISLAGYISWAAPVDVVGLILTGTGSRRHSDKKNTVTNSDATDL
jgi:hypothetical protein